MQPPSTPAPVYDDSLVLCLLGTINNTSENTTAKEIKEIILWKIVEDASLYNFEVVTTSSDYIELSHDSYKLMIAHVKDSIYKITLCIPWNDDRDKPIIELSMETQDEKRLKKALFYNIKYDRRAVHKQIISGIEYNAGLINPYIPNAIHPLNNNYTAVAYLNKLESEFYNLYEK